MKRTVSAATMGSSAIPYEMPMDYPISSLFAMMILITGLSLVVQAPRWWSLLKEMAAMPHRLFPLALYMLIIGLGGVTFHNIWTIEWRLVITLVGWLTLVIACVLLIAPELLIRYQPPLRGGVFWTRILGGWLALSGALLFFFRP